MVVMTALASALAYAVAMVLQQRGAERTDPDTALKPGLLVQLVAQPWWLVGIAANVVGFALRASALAHGSLVLVQPVLLTGLVFALRASALAHGSLVLVQPVLLTGLSLFAVAASPGDGATSASMGAWLVVAATVILLASVAIGQAQRAREAPSDQAAGAGARARPAGGVRAAWNENGNLAI